MWIGVPHGEGIRTRVTDLEAFAQEPQDEEVEGRDDEGEDDHDGDARDGVAQVVAADVLPRRFDEDAEVGLQIPARSPRPDKPKETQLLADLSIRVPPCLRLMQKHPAAECLIRSPS